MSDGREQAQILVVEDTEAMAKLTMMTLKRGGFETVFHAADGEAAIEYLEQNEPHLILLDLNLPGISGWGVAEFLEHRYGAGNIPVIVTTAMGDSANRVVGRLQNIYRYMVKPFTPQDLIETVEAALGL
jgi:DNA-binding response OmpR family regulator